MANINCGTLSPVQGKSTKFQGTLRLGKRLNDDIILVDNPRRDLQGKNAPAYDVLRRASGTKDPFNPSGAAWIKNSENVDGGDFLSITMDDPDWDSPLNLAAFPGKDAAQPWQVQWSRPRRDLPARSRTETPDEGARQEPDDDRFTNR